LSIVSPRFARIAVNAFRFFILHPYNNNTVSNSRAIFFRFGCAKNRYRIRDVVDFQQTLSVDGSDNNNRT
jgi:hypothetical protein